jgi:two-component system, NtrC family, response regulator AtoC
MSVSPPTADRPAGTDIRNSLILGSDQSGIGLAVLSGVCERILVVDDDDGVRGIYQSHFSGAGFEVHSAATLQEAAERLAGHTFDAVIADICLTPEVGSEGLAIAAFLRHQRHAPPVLVLTAYGAPDRAEAAARLGVDAFLHKPVSLVWLESLLRARIDDRRRGTEIQPMAAAG